MFNNNKDDDKHYLKLTFIVFNDILLTFSTFL